MTNLSTLSILLLFFATFYNLVEARKKSKEVPSPWNDGQPNNPNQPAPNQNEPNWPNPNPGQPWPNGGQLPNPQLVGQQPDNQPFDGNRMDFGSGQIQDPDQPNQPAPNQNQPNVPNSNPGQPTFTSPDGGQLPNPQSVDQQQSFDGNGANGGNRMDFGSGQIQDPFSLDNGDDGLPSAEDDGKGTKKGKKKKGDKNKEEGQLGNANVSAEIQKDLANDGKNEQNNEKDGKKKRKEGENGEKDEEEPKFGNGEIQGGGKEGKEKEEEDDDRKEEKPQFGSGEIQKGRKGGEGGGKSVSVESDDAGGDAEGDYYDGGGDVGNNGGGLPVVQGNQPRNGNGLNGFGQNGRNGIGPIPRQPSNYDDYGQGNSENVPSDYDYGSSGMGGQGGGIGTINNRRGGGNNVGQFGDQNYDDFDDYGSGGGNNNNPNYPPLNPRRNNLDNDQYYGQEDGIRPPFQPGNGQQPYNAGTLPEFLRLVSAADRQQFLQLEMEEDRSKRVVDQEKQRWANQRGQRVANLYNQFVRRQNQQKQQYGQRRAQMARQRLSAAAQAVDARIQAIINNPDQSRRSVTLAIDRILQNTGPQIRQELQRQISVIGPLDGNLSPLISNY